MSDILDMGGRVSLVTGAGQGVGAQIAKHLASASNSGGIAVNDYFLERAEAVANVINSWQSHCGASRCQRPRHGRSDGGQNRRSIRPGRRIGQ